MKLVKIIALFLFVSFFSIQIPFTDVNVSLVGNVEACKIFWECNEGGDDSDSGVPEPTTMLLLGAGLTGAFVYRKYKNRK